MALVVFPVIHALTRVAGYTGKRRYLYLYLYLYARLNALVAGWPRRGARPVPDAAARGFAVHIPDRPDNPENVPLD